MNCWHIRCVIWKHPPFKDRYVFGCSTEITFCQQETVYICRNYQRVTPNHQLILQPRSHSAPSLGLSLLWSAIVFPSLLLLPLPKRVCLTCKLQSEQSAARHCRSSMQAMPDCRLPAYESMHGYKRESCMYIHIPVCVLVCNNASCRDMQQALPEYSLCRCLLSWRRGDDGRNCGYIVDVYPAVALRDNAVVLSAWRCLPSFPYFSFLHMAGRWQPYALFPALSFPLCSSVALNDSPGNLNQI